MKTLGQVVFLTVIGAIFFLASGCQTGPNVTYNPGVDFTQYKTFALEDLNWRGPISDPTAPLRQRVAVRTSLAETLARKGFIQVKPDEADFIVNAYAKFMPHSPEVNSFEERTAVVEIIDAKSKEVVWSRSRTIYSNSAMLPEAAGRLAALMIEPFPPDAEK